MLPFLRDKIAARKLLIYKDGDGDHPVNAAEVTNNTAKTLDGGPITVYDARPYAGEALVETFKAGDKRLIGYAVDYGTLVEKDLNGGEKLLREVSARNGILTLRYAETRHHYLHHQNVDPKAKTLIVQQEGTDYKILSPKTARNAPRPPIALKFAFPPTATRNSRWNRNTSSPKKPL